jgi:phosphopantothenoylcysteine decarboxylase/phosphopantothenate--cysteine ligase
MAAAVCDFRPHKVSKGKLRRGASLDITLASTEDIVGTLARDKGAKVVVGFALETENEIEAGREKLKKKNLDLVFANNPQREGCDFGSDTNAGYLIHRDGKVEEVGLVSKDELADRILESASLLFS